MDLVPKGPNGPKGYEFMRDLAAAFEQAEGVSVPALHEAGIIILDDPAGTADKIREVRDDIGQQEVFCWMRIGGLSDESVRDSMRLFAEEVMPEFQAKEPVIPDVLRG